jgi:hypothetical protein
MPHQNAGRRRGRDTTIDYLSRLRLGQTRDDRFDQYRAIRATVARHEDRARGERAGKGSGISTGHSG